MLRFLIILVCVLAPGILSAQENRVIEIQDENLLKSIFFGGGSWYVDDDQTMELKQFLEQFDDLNKYEISIHSHTDNIGGVEYNRWLSKMRGQAVYEQLLLLNVPAELITIEDFGLENPLYDNRSWAGKRMNRRVDIVLWPISF